MEICGKSGGGDGRPGWTVSFGALSPRRPDLLGDGAGALLPLREILADSGALSRDWLEEMT